MRCCTLDRLYPFVHYCRDSFAFRGDPRVADPERPITAFAASPRVAKSGDAITKNVQGRSRRLLMAVDETDVVQSNRVKSRFYSPDDEVLLQSMLTTLADLDFAYEQERKRVSGSTEDVNLRARISRSCGTNTASDGTRTFGISQCSSGSCRSSVPVSVLAGSAEIRSSQKAEPAQG